MQVFFRQRHYDRFFLLHCEAVHSDYSAPMNLDEPTPAHGTASTLDPLIARAEELIRQFKECFWFWHPDARVLTRDDIPMVIKNLRQYGNKQAWRAAQELRKCL